MSSKATKKLDTGRRRPERNRVRWPYYAAAAAAAILVFYAYGPSLNGGFLFDDVALPFALPSAREPLLNWIRGVRPLLYFTYWINAQLSGDNPYSYHVLNVLIHCGAGALVYAAVRRLIGWAGIPDPRRTLLAGFAAFLFLLHPVQTEAVAYLAGRSESLSTMVALAAFVVFLYRKDRAIGWGTTVAVAGLSAAALLCKEQTVAIAGLLLVTDYWWNPGFSFEGIRGNWRLYALMAVGGAAGLFALRGLIFHATTAGFGLKDFTWYQYFFTQWRALWVYLREFVAPVGLRADWDFPISKTPFDQGAIFGLIGLVLLGGAAWYFRRRFRLASYGFFAWLILMAPTSSILPIQDPIAERRLYFGMIGLLLIAVDLLSRVTVRNLRFAAACLGVVLIGEAALTSGRAAIWADDLALWKDTVQKSPNKARDRFHLAFAYYEAGDNRKAVEEFENAERLGPGSAKADLLVDWGLAYVNLNRTADAIAKFREAAALDPTAHVYSQIGMAYGQADQWDAALEALDRAEKIDPNWKFTYFYRGLVYFKTGRFEQSVSEYKRALAIDPSFQQAFDGLREAQAALRAKH
ncbi:MAG TPA: tetratricopeptide repeat protein [Candidatus Limnocylindrales bacterium]|nr:tetratricopeptide repeat protein [Candidatus Limnocylindrales bacterium]